MSMGESIKEHGLTVVGGIIGSLLIVFVGWLAREFDTLRTEFTAMTETVQTLDENSGDRYPGAIARDDNLRQNDQNMDFQQRLSFLEGFNAGRDTCDGD